jgi:hypothetical protein
MTTSEWSDRMHDEFAARTRDDIAGLRQAQTEAIARNEKMFEAVGRACKEHTDAVREEVRAQGRKLDKQDEKLDALAETKTFTSAQKTTMITTGIAGIATIVATVLTGGPT